MYIKNTKLTLCHLKGYSEGNMQTEENIQSFFVQQLYTSLSIDFLHLFKLLRHFNTADEDYWREIGIWVLT